MLTFLWLNTAAFAIVGLAGGGYGVLHSGLHVAGLAVLRRCSGSQFDERVVDALVAVVSRDASAVEVNA